MGFSRMEAGRSFALERRTSDVGVKRKTRRKDVFSVLIIVRRAMRCGRGENPSVRQTRGGGNARECECECETRNAGARFPGLAVLPLLFRFKAGGGSPREP